MDSFMFYLVTYFSVASGQTTPATKKDSFITYPQNTLVLFGEDMAEFHCSLKDHGILIWSYGELLNELRLIAKGGSMKATLPSVTLEELDVSNEKLKIEKISFTHSGIYLCRDSLKKAEKYGKLLVYKIPVCNMIGNDSFSCEASTSIGVVTSAELTCGDRIIRKSASKSSVRTMNMMNKELRYVVSLYQWNQTDFTDCELKFGIEFENTIHEFLSARVTWVNLNITSGYTLLQDVAVKCTSSAGFLSNFNIIVMRSNGSIYTTTSNDTFGMNELGTFTINCTASGTFGLASKSSAAVDVKVQTTYAILPCVQKGALECFQSYKELFDEAVHTRALLLSEVQRMCDDYNENCINYMQPCIWTRKVRGLKNGLDFICDNLNHEFLPHLFNITGGRDCVNLNFLNLPLKDDYLSGMALFRNAVTPLDLIHESAAKFLEDAIRETCIERLIDQSFNKTIKEWIFKYRGLHFSDDIHTFSEFIDENNELQLTSECFETATASPKNYACFSIRKCIKILVGFSKLIYKGLVVVTNLKKFASELCDSSIKEVQECSHSLKDFYTDHSIYMAINHITVFFGTICERHWSNFIQHISCLQRSLKDDQFIAHINNCTQELRANLEEYKVLNDTFLNPDNQTSMCRRVSDFLTCQEKAVTTICNEDFAKLQRKLSRLAFSTDMEELFCYNTFSY